MLSGTAAIVTGGSTGIGRAIAAEYLAEGAEVVASRHAESGEATAGELGCGRT